MTEEVLMLLGSKYRISFHLDGTMVHVMLVDIIPITPITQVVPIDHYLREGYLKGLVEYMITKLEEREKERKELSTVNKGVLRCTHCKEMNVMRRFVIENKEIKTTLVGQFEGAEIGCRTAHLFDALDIAVEYRKNWEVKTWSYKFH